LADFQNPQQDPGTERRLLVAIALTFLVILAFEPFLKKYFPQLTPPPAKTESVVKPATPPQAPPAPGNAMRANTNPAAIAKGAKKAPAPTAEEKQAASESETIVENDLYRITFTNRGAQVKSWILKKYKDDQGRPLDLVNSAAAPKYGYPLSLWTYDATLRGTLNSELYVASATGAMAVPGKLTFEYAGQGLTVKKTFTFGSGYVIHVDSDVTSNGAHVDAFPAWPAGMGDQTTIAFFNAGQVEYQSNSTTEHLAAKKVSGNGTLHGLWNWAGVGDAYFGAAFIPDDPQNVSLITLRNPIDIAKDPAKPTETQSVDVLGAAVGNVGGPTSERLFVGPKSLEVVESVHVPTISGADKDLGALINFGFWGSIAKPLFIWLRWTYNHWIPNWGWAIVIQTLIISIAMLPLRVKQLKSAFKMQKAAPQIKAIQERYKKYSMRDPRKAEMNKEIAELYKKENVNPVGGCLPMLVPIILIWPYYRMLEIVIDLRQAPWLWIHDLSARDPYFVLPIVMVLSMFFTQRTMPQTGMDPAQQKMMNWMMPLMMGFIFFNLAAGVNLYYLVSNLVSVAQQAVMNRTKLGQEMREVAQKRARKKELKSNK
jgi:YidC/Oxa1 family membrane protein insertase